MRVVRKKKMFWLIAVALLSSGCVPTPEPSTIRLLGVELNSKTTVEDLAHFKEHGYTLYDIQEEWNELAEMYGSDESDGTESKSANESSEGEYIEYEVLDANGDSLAHIGAVFKPNTLDVLFVRGGRYADECDDDCGLHLGMSRNEVNEYLTSIGYTRHVSFGPSRLIPEVDTLHTTEYYSYGNSKKMNTSLSYINDKCWQIHMAFSRDQILYLTEYYREVIERNLKNGT